MSGYDDRDLAALDRLEDMLNAYCESRLMPQGPVLSRVRTNVLAQHAAAAAAMGGGARLAVAGPGPRLGRWTMQAAVPRRAFALGFAAMLTVSTTAAVMAAPPGSPFYNARVYLETLVMPAQADDLLAAHVRLLDQRVLEATAAVARGDTVGLSAALVAYQAEVDAATADVGEDAARLAHLEDVLAKHTTALTALAARLPEQASIDNAIQASSKAITKLKAQEPKARPVHSPQRRQVGGQNGGSGGPAGDSGSQGGQSGSQGGASQNEDAAHQ